MNAIEIRGLTKCFRGMYALDGLNMTVPQGAIYGFIGENGSGKSTTEKCICGHLVPDKGKITLFGKPYTDAGVRAKLGALIENTGCFPSSSVHANLMMQAINLGLKDREGEIRRVLKIVRMEEHAKLTFKKCSLGMKQRIGIAMALLGDPALLILDEPINGLDADGMRLMREILVDITKNYGCTVLISSHILGELEKIATHYGILRQGKMIKEIAASEMDGRAKAYVSLRTEDMLSALALVRGVGCRAELTEGELRLYGVEETGGLSALLLQNGQRILELKKHKIGLEEYYEDLMRGREA